MVHVKVGQPKSHTTNIPQDQNNIGGKVDNMGKSKLRGGKKAHNKRVSNRNQEIKKQEVIVEALRRKIYDEAKERYLQEQANPKENILNIKLNG